MISAKCRTVGVRVFPWRGVRPKVKSSVNLTAKVHRAKIPSATMVDTGTPFHLPPNAGVGRAERRQPACLPAPANNHDSRMNFSGCTFGKMIASHIEKGRGSPECTFDQRRVLSSSEAGQENLPGRRSSVLQEGQEPTKCAVLSPCSLTPEFNGAELRQARAARYQPHLRYRDDNRINCPCYSVRKCLASGVTVRGAGAVRCHGLFHPARL